MNADNSSHAGTHVADSILPATIKSATPLTPLQLNGVKMDVKHTILTPQYLEGLDATNNFG